ncbi:MAG: Gfo/Idh/MocA family oxidoreductase [Prolixibacteraceae bacterium]
MKTRRDFLKNTAAVSAGALLVPAFIRCGDKKAPNDKINIACIGLGSHGIQHNLKNFLKLDDLCRVVAVCDVYKPLAGKAKKLVDETYGNKDCKTYQDFREVLARPDIDAVQITTPDHWHVPMSIISMNSGKHVSCEKPTLTIDEGRMLVNAVNRTGKIFGVSVEDRFLPNYQQMVQLVKGGRIGELQKIEIELPVREMPEQGYEFTDPPKDFDYELWCGPAPKHPYSPARCLYNFRWNFDYAGGTIADWLPHQGETAQWMTGYEMSGPVQVEPLKPTVFHSGIYNTPKVFDILYTYENGVTMKVTNGIPWIRAIGSEGWIESKGWNKPLTASNEKLLQLPDNPLKVPHTKGEHYDFLMAVKSGGETVMHPELGHRTSTVCHIGNIAALLNRKLEWDAQKEAFVNDPEANAMRSKKPREEWSYEKVINMKF